MKRAFVVLMLGLVGATQLSCNVNDYCLNCGTGDGGHGSGDGGDGDGNGTDDGGGSGDGGTCIPSGPEICDGKDNDCNGFVDDGVLPQVGDLCANQVGACAGGVQQCVAGVLKCTKTPTPETCDNIDNDCNGLTDEGDPGGGSKCGTDVGECVAGTNHCMSGAIQCIGFQDHTTDPELCNLRDDNCNGSFDEGLTNMGACGIKTCVGGTNKGTICTSNANCTGGGVCTINVGECHQGTLACMGGAPQCDAVQQGFIPHLEICDNKDNDCDGVTDEGFDLNTDINNCMVCGHQCIVPASFNAFATCTGGTCGFSCKAGYHDVNGLPGDGCEYGPCFPSGVEVCDGADNDCDGLTDAMDPDLGAAPNICLSAGACSTGTTISCDGASGWTCHYGSNVSVDAMGHIIPETICDGIDNDCNNIIDDHQRPQLGTNCDDGNKGECRSFGTYQCDGVTANPAICVYSHNGIASAPESCDNKDNDCDGVIDNTATPGTFPNGGINWVDIGNGKQMMQYEASKPDATATDSGNVVTNQCGAATTVAAANGATEVGTVATFTTTTAHNLAVGRVVVVSGVSVAGYNGTWSVASIVSPTKFTATLPAGLLAGVNGTVAPVCPTCSQASTIPWTNVTYAQAVSACQAVGANLCTEQQWHRTCSVVAPATYPIALGMGAVDTLIEAEDYSGIGAASGHVWVEDYTNGFSGISDMQSSPDSGSSIANGNVQAQAPHLDYAINFQKASSSYHIWLRMWSPSTASGNRAVMNLDGVLPVNNDRFTQPTNANTWEWIEREGGAVTVAAGVHTMRIYMERDGVKVDAIQIREAATTPAAPANPKGNTWAYAVNPNTYQTTTCNGQDYDPLQDTTLPTGSLASCYANVGTHVLDMSGNVKEWTAARQTGQNPIRGGAANSTDVGTSCALNFTLGSDAFFFPNVGFRCCR